MLERAMCRGAAALCCIALTHCSLLVDLSGLDTSSAEAGGSGAGSDGGAPYAVDNSAAGSMGDGGEGQSSMDSEATTGTADDEGGGLPDDDAQWPDDAAAWPDDADDAAAPVEAGSVDPGATEAGPDAGCVTSFLDGGGRVLFDFDEPGGASGWTGSAGTGGPAVTIARTTTDGNTCPGALELTAPFATYNGASAYATFNYDPPTSWSNWRLLHVWTKMVIDGDAGDLGYRAMNGLQLFVQSDNFSSYASQFANTPTYTDGQWHEITLELFAPDGGRPNGGGPDVVVNSVQRIGLAVVPFSSKPSDGPNAPPTVTVLLDDVWLE
jgi:hypothetical protein